MQIFCPLFLHHSVFNTLLENHINIAWLDMLLSILKRPALGKLFLSILTLCWSKQI
jgi:hypothetical protein